MITWQQCLVLWGFVGVTLLTPVVRLVAARMLFSLAAAVFFMVFGLLNAVNVGAWNSRTKEIENYGLPYSYYDNRDPEHRMRFLATVLPGRKAITSDRFSLPSLVGNVGAYLFVVVAAAWPVGLIEACMRRYKSSHRPETEFKYPR